MSGLVPRPLLRGVEVQTFGGPRRSRALGVNPLQEVGIGASLRDGHGIPPSGKDSRARGGGSADRCRVPVRDELCRRLRAPICPSGQDRVYIRAELGEWGACSLTTTSPLAQLGAATSPTAPIGSQVTAGLPDGDRSPQDASLLRISPSARPRGAETLL